MCSENSFRGISPHPFFRDEVCVPGSRSVRFRTYMKVVQDGRGRFWMLPARYETSILRKTFFPLPIRRVHRLFAFEIGFNGMGDAEFMKFGVIANHILFDPGRFLTRAWRLSTGTHRIFKGMIDPDFKAFRVKCFFKTAGNF